jgi:hypothetical protein
MKLFKKRKIKSGKFVYSYLKGKIKLSTSEDNSRKEWVESQDSCTMDVCSVLLQQKLSCSFSRFIPHISTAIYI